MKNHILTLLTITCVITVSHQAYCNGKPKNGTSNKIPVWSDDPIFVREVKGARLYKVGSSELNQTMDLVHVWGDTPYEMGFNMGLLMKDKLPEFVDAVYDYLAQ